MGNAFRRSGSDNLAPQAPGAVANVDVPVTPITTTPAPNLDAANSGYARPIHLDAANSGYARPTQDVTNPGYVHLTPRADAGGVTLIQRTAPSDPLAAAVRDGGQSPLVSERRQPPRLQRADVKPKGRHTNNVITPLGPNHPHFVHEETRFLTFRDWPRAMPQKPKDLAEAGFFYFGRGDFARCFYCGLGLKDWDPTDTPWTEHARWSPRCAFVQLVKGEDFINAARRPHSTLDEYREDPDSSDEGETPEQLESDKPEDEPKPQSNPKPQNGLSPRSESDPTELLRENTRLREDRLCRICYDREANIVFVPCGHLATCGNCASAFSDCPVCRAPIQQLVKTFAS